MKVKCFKCGNIEDFSETVPLKAECEKCLKDLHICKNCEFYSEESYNECKESNAERVLDKEKANYCDYFRAKNFDNSPNATNSNNTKEDVYKKLDNLFK